MQMEFRRAVALACRRVFALCAVIFWVVTSTAAQAQGSSGLPLSELMQQMTDPRLNGQGQSVLSQGGGSGGQVLGVITGGASADAAAAETGVIPAAPVAGRGAPLPESRLEQIFSTRAGVRLQQFGYEQVGRPSSVTVPLTGAMSDDYVLGPGDQILVSLRGQENGEYRANVDRNGQVTLPRINPISATGRTFGSFRQDLEAAVHRSYVATEAFISVGNVRQISVLVAGEINNPGQRLVSGLSSALDAILISGGVKKTGSLRNIRIQRGGREFAVDLYSALTGTGSASTVHLADGDRILVPPLGPTVAVAGLARKPGIYELPAHASSISVRNLLALAGGLEIKGRYRLSVLRVAANGGLQMAPLADQSGTIGDSEILNVQLGADQTVSQALLSGASALAGSYPVITGTKLSDVLKSPGAMPLAPYTLFGIIARKDPKTLLRTLIPFTPVAVLGGSEDMALQGDDVIRVLSVNEARLLTNTVRLYTQLQTVEQSAILNPLAPDPNDVTSLPATAPVPANTDPALAAAQAQQAQQIRNAAEQTLSLADRQRRDIAQLANQVDPVTQQAIQAANQAQQEQLYEYQQQNAPASNQANQANSGSFAGLPYQSSGNPGDGSSVYQTGQGNTAGGVAPYGNNIGAMQAQRAVRPPALNFQSADADAGQIASNREISNFGDLSRQLGIDQLVLMNFLIDHQVSLNGAVGGPGSYFVGPNVPLQALVQAAGGTTNWADESGVELVSTEVDTQSGHSMTRQTQLPLRQGTLANYIVRPRDQLRFNQVFTDSGLGSVTVQGEVRFSGTFQISRGEHLSNLLARAGGLTSTAYPYGTVFLRKSAAQTEHDGYIRASQEIEEELVVAMTRIGNDKIDSSSFAALQGFVTQLRNQKAVGRISIAADPSVLATKPELDPLLEPGDVVYIPQRPSTITVLGQVMQPGSLPYRSGNTLEDYVQMAGGYSPTSDASNIFIVLPDGSARKVETSWLNFSSVNLPPGSSIVVPRDITPLDTRQLILDVTGIFSGLAVTAASLAVLSHQ
jgi:protein involved in polysaccharide export with SLBB domain